MSRRRILPQRSYFALKPFQHICSVNRALKNSIFRQAVNQSCFRTVEVVISRIGVNFFMGGPPPEFGDRPEGKSGTIAFCGFGPAKEV